MATKLIIRNQRKCCAVCAPSTLMTCGPPRRRRSQRWYFLVYILFLGLVRVPCYERWCPLHPLVIDGRAEGERERERERPCKCTITTPESFTGSPWPLYFFLCLYSHENPFFLFLLLLQKTPVALQLGGSSSQPKKKTFFWAREKKRKRARTDWPLPSYT